MIVVLKDGKPLQYSHGYNKSFADLVKETAAEIFDFQTAEDTGRKVGRTKRKR